MKIGINTPHRS